MPELQQSANQVITPRTNIGEVPQFGMWVGFLYIIYFISLYVWATSFGNILHEVVNRYVSDALEIEEAKRAFWGYWGRDYLIRWSLSALVIFYPVFALTHLLIQNLIFKRSETINVRSRKILIYITLIGTFLISCYQFVKFVYTFLDGSTSMRTAAHFGVTLSIAGLIFIFYLRQVRRDKD